jgi:hypothetical protein
VTCPAGNGICKLLIFQPGSLSILSNMREYIEVDPHFIIAVAAQKNE